MQKNRTVVTVGLHTTGLTSRIIRNLQQGMQARYLAEAGIHHALLQLNRDSAWRDGIGTTAMGNGTYSVTVNQPTTCDPITLTATGGMGGAQRTVTNILTAPSFPFQTGTYTGNNSSTQTITGLGFQPDVVFVKSEQNKEGVGRTSTMIGDASKKLETGAALSSNHIESIDADGFTVGSSNEVNQNNKEFYWMAWQAVSGTVAVGTYMGNATDNRLIDISDTSSSTDFQPTYVILLPASNKKAQQRLAEMASDTSFKLHTDSALANRIQDFVATGFVIGDDHDVNQNGEDYHYIAWRAVPGHIETGTYVGDGTDNRDIDPVCFTPAVVLIKQDGTRNTAYRPASVGAAEDKSLEFGKDQVSNNKIQNFHVGGFQLGTKPAVNDNGDTYFWIAFR